MSRPTSSVVMLALISIGLAAALLARREATAAPAPPQSSLSSALERSAILFGLSQGFDTIAGPGAIHLSDPATSRTFFENRHQNDPTPMTLSVTVQNVGDTSVDVIVANSGGDRIPDVINDLPPGAAGSALVEVVPDDRVYVQGRGDGSAISILWGVRLFYANRFP